MRVAARTNRLLAALPDWTLSRWLPHMRAMEMTVGDVLAGPGGAGHVWFPSTAVVSLLYGGECGAPAEVALVGREGMVGLPLLMGAAPCAGSAVVQCTGWGFRLEAEALKVECGQDVSVLRLLLRYAHALLTQMAQTAICNRRHSLPQQLGRLLLHCFDRIEGDELSLTHEQMARMLGVRRGGVTEAAIDLQQAGAIRYARGRITLLDRHALEARVCPCYRVIEEENARVFVAEMSVA